MADASGRERGLRPRRRVCRLLCRPWSTSPTASARAPTAARDCRPQPIARILVVEDQPALSRVTVALLRKLGHEVRAAADGPEALLAVKEYNPEVVLLDIGLPGMDGYEVAHCLRSEMGDPTRRCLVAMTGYGQHEVNRHARKAEFDHHLVKPADIGACCESC